MIYGVGTDIVEIERFQRGGEPLGGRFLERCFSERERNVVQGRPLEVMAGLFAAKEAVAKALGTGFVGFRPSALEIVHDAAGKPEVVLHGGAAEIARKAGVVRVDVSISHCKSYATAFAVASTE
ncbi:MAG: holo-ACP synthase [Turicibacter sp.]|nr:holo-ACP synthase [Turicibacter sp.]